MKKIKLVETILNTKSEIMEEIDYTQKPDYKTLDITVLADETYKPTVQSILIDLEESSALHESESDKLSINILSETVNEKTNYSTSLFEFESRNCSITLSLAITESDKYNGVFNVSSYTTKGEKVFETNTRTPKKVIKEYMNSLSDEYLLDRQTTLSENKL